MPSSNDKLTDRQRTAIKRVAALIIINAMIFQEVLSQRNSRVKPLQQFENDADPIGTLTTHWKFILDEINYYPIFHIAHRLLCCVSSDQSLVRAVKELLKTARQIVSWKAAFSHDLAGRIFHRLLAEAKYLGAYYTSIPAAVLLAKLALNPKSWDYDWSDLEALKQIRVADLACGTGTLLMAAADAILDNHIRSCAAKGVQPRLQDLHNLLVSEILYGFDVLDSAVHLTASTLALRNPEIPINVTHLASLGLGGPMCQLGSLDFLDPSKIGSTFMYTSVYMQPERVVGRLEDRDTGPEQLPQLDLCVMNPPFTRSVGGNLLFGQFPAKERSRMQTRLKNLVKHQNLSASITAGLGAVFIALADRFLKEKGRLALVIPRALLSGVAWGKTRRLIEESYHLEWLIVSHEPGHWNFSENTDLSEVLVIARKRGPSDPRESERVKCVNLWRHPRNAVEALSVARALLGSDPPDVQNDPGTLEIAPNGEKLGEALSVPWPWLRGRLWSFPCAFAQTELVRALFHLLDGKLYLPGAGQFPKEGRIPLCMLKDLGELGFDRRDIHDGFTLARSPTSYPAFWGHDAEAVLSMAQRPNRYLNPRAQAAQGRPLRQASDLWQKAGRILIAERLWLKTMRLTAVFVSTKALSNVWWPLSTAITEDQQKALVLWLNSAPGLLMLLGHRVETRGAWVDFKKPLLEQMPVLDVRNIGGPALKRMSQAFDELGNETLLPFPEMANDLTRAAIDEAVASALGLPDLTPIRQLLAREPIISLSLEVLLEEKTKNPREPHGAR